MSITQATRGITLTLILASYVSSTIVNAQPDQQSGERRGPPPQAIEVCADQTEGDACLFAGHRGEVSGSCVVPPQTQGQLVCAPEGGPAQGRGQK